MKKLTTILFLFLMTIMNGQDSYGDIEKVSSWMEDVVAQADFAQSVEILNGTIFIQAKAGDHFAIWDASGITLQKYDIAKDGEFEFKTDYLHQGKYFFGIKRKNTQPVIKPLEISPL